MANKKRYKARYIVDGVTYWGNSFESPKAAYDKAVSSYRKTLTPNLPKNEQREGVTVHDAAITLYYPTLASKSDNTKNVYWRDCYKKHIEPAIGNMPYKDVRKIQIVNMVAGLRNKNGSRPAASVIENILIVARGIFTELVENGYLESNPVVASIVAPPRPPQKPLRVSREMIEEKKLLCSPHMRVVIELGAELGLRLGEIAALQWAHIQGTTIVIQEQRTKTVKAKLPKGEKIREIGVSEVFIQRLHEIGNIDSKFISTSASGRQWSLTRLGEEVRKLGFPKGVGLHELRHLAITEMAQLNALATQKIAGHSSFKTTQGYIHMSEVSTADLVSRRQTTK